MIRANANRRHQGNASSSSVIIQLVPTEISLISSNYLHDTPSDPRIVSRRFFGSVVGNRCMRFALRRAAASSFLSSLIFPWAARVWARDSARFKDLRHASRSRERGIDAPFGTRNFVDRNVHGIAQLARNRASHIARSRRISSESARAEVHLHLGLRGAVSSPAPPPIPRFFPALYLQIRIILRRMTYVHITCHLRGTRFLLLLQYFAVALFFLISLLRGFNAASHVTTVYDTY